MAVPATTQHARCGWGYAPGQRLIQVAFLGSLLALSTTTIHFVQKDERSRTTNSNSVVSRASSLSSSSSSLSSSSSSLSSTFTNTDDAAVFEQWKAALGCNDTTIQVCHDKIQEVADKQAAERTIWEKRVPEAQHRADSTGFDDYNNLSLIKQHPALTPLLPAYQPDPSWSNNTAMFPRLNVVGLAKTGTSQLYKILTNHPDAVADNEKKEYCMYGANHISWDTAEVAAATDHDKRTVQANLYTWHQQAAAVATEAKAQESQQQQRLLTVNGCLNLHDTWLHLHYIRPSNAKYFILLRDPADWLFAGWNFWVDDVLDSRGQAAQGSDAKKLWASATTEYRSPELFHELIISGHATKSGTHLLDILRRQTVTAGRRLVALAGKEQVLFLKNEDMLPEHIDRSGGMLDQIANFTGLARSKFKGPGLHTMLNCNDNKGFQSKCGGQEEGSSSRGSYEIAGHRKMLEKTRAFIYLQYQEECLIWKEEFGITYPDCVNVLEKRRVD
jgi:hypothetical protein